MSILPALKAIEIIRALARGGFRIIRQTGSHVRMRHGNDQSRITTIPIHSKDISRSVLSSILRQTKLSTQEFLRLLRKK